MGIDQNWLGSMMTHPVSEDAHYSLILKSSLSPLENTTYCSKACHCLHVCHVAKPKKFLSYDCQGGMEKNIPSFSYQDFLSAMASKWPMNIMFFFNFTWSALAICSLWSSSMNIYTTVNGYGIGNPWTF